MKTKPFVVGMSIVSCVACGWENSDSMSRDTLEEDLTLGSVQQAQTTSDARLEAWGSAVEEAMAVGASYDEVQEMLESFGRVSFSFPGHVLRQEYPDITLDDSRNKDFIDLHFKENRLTCYSVGSDFDLSSLVPATGDICQFRPGQTTVAELIAILGSPEFACADTATFRVRVAGTSAAPCH